MEYEVVDDTLNKEVLNEPEVSIPPEDEVEDVDDEGEGEGEETEEEKKAASLLGARAKGMLARKQVSEMKMKQRGVKSGEEEDGKGSDALEDEEDQVEGNDEKENETKVVEEFEIDESEASVNAATTLQSRTRGMIVRKQVSESPAQDLSNEKDSHELAFDDLIFDDPTPLGEKIKVQTLRDDGNPYRKLVAGGLLANKQKLKVRPSSQPSDENMQNDAIVTIADNTFSSQKSSSVYVDLDSANPDDVFADQNQLQSPAAIAKQRIKREAMARRRGMEARQRKEEMEYQELAQSQSQSKTKRRGKSDAAFSTRIAEGEAGLPPLKNVRIAPTAPTAPQASKFGFKRPGGNVVNSHDESDFSDTTANPFGITGRGRLPNIGDYQRGDKGYGDSGGSGSPYRDRDRDRVDRVRVAAKKRSNVPLYKRIEETYERKQQESERVKQMEYQKAKQKKQLNQPTSEEIREHRINYDIKQRQRDDAMKQRRDYKAMEKEHRIRYEPAVQNKRPPGIREQFIDHNLHENEASHSRKRGYETGYKSLIRQELEEKKTAKQREFQLRQEKLNRVRKYGERVRAAAPGTENSHIDNYDIDVQGQEQESPNRMGYRPPINKMSNKSISRLPPVNDPRNDQHQYRQTEDDSYIGPGNKNRTVYGRYNYRSDDPHERSPAQRLDYGVGHDDEGFTYGSTNHNHNRLPLEPIQKTGDGNGNTGNRSRRAIKDSNRMNGQKKVSQWVTQLMNSDGDEDNLAKVYETGFQMLMAEKGIIPDI